MSELRYLEEKLKKFSKDRNWEQYQNPKDLSLSLCLEASELLENFQWLSPEEAVSVNMQNIKEELADVFIYTLQIAMKLEIDLLAEADKKIDKNALKYPISEGVDI